MNLYQPTITGSLSVSGSVNISGSITIAGGGTISGTASIATTALTASSADNLLVRNTLTAQTLVVQTITSSVDFVTGSTRFGSISANTHVFTGSLLLNGSSSIQSVPNGVGEYYYLTAKGGYNNGFSIYEYSGNQYINASGSMFLRYNNLGGTTGVFAIVSGSSEVLRITATGSVGIGTSNPTAPLTIAVPAVGSAIGASNAQTAFDYSRFRIKHYSDSNLGLSMGYAGANSTYIQACYNEGSVAPLSLNSFGGNVGIGTTSPGDILDVQKNQNAITNFYFQNTNTTNTNSRAYLNVVSGNNTLSLRSINGDNCYVVPSLNTAALYLGYNNAVKITSGVNLEYNYTPNANYHIATDAGKISVANGGTIDFPTFSGLVIINNHSNGNVGMWMVGAGNTVLVSQVYGAAVGTMAYNGGINGYTWTSNHGSTALYGFFAVRTRSNA
jgi:hypothetical protein